MKLEEFLQKSNLARSKAFQQSSRFLEHISDNELPKPFFIADRDEEINPDEEKMRKHKERQLMAEKEEELRRKELKVKAF